MEKIKKDNDTWKSELTPEQYRVLREKGTEPAFSGELLNNKEVGMYICGACGNELFSSDTKFDSGSGWPSFWESIDSEKIELHHDDAYGMRRTEVVCARCGSHLGHLFDDAPQTPTGQRYCINSASLAFRKKETK
ncbi:MAG TPA: peptide-methionine (R)-S-oxide reductase MsrB [Patescibacteria group bacterium]